MPGCLAAFPAPYPDECWYSILCRYHVRIGGTQSSATIRALFGTMTSLSGFLLIPRRLDLLGTWLAPGSLITPEMVTYDNSCYGWLSIALSSSHLQDFEDSLFVGKPNPGLERALFRKATAGRRHAFLRFCPECALEDIRQFGEAYWHRLPQLPGIEYCPVHGCRIQDSDVSLAQIQYHFFPASACLRNCKTMPDDPSFQLYRDKYLQIANDTTWLLQNGRCLGGSERIARIYRDCLVDRKLASAHNGICHKDDMIAAFIGFHGETFLHQIVPGDQDPRIRLRCVTSLQPAPRLNPLLHILMMEFSAESVEAFSALAPRPTPYGHGPWPCINRLCPDFGKHRAQMIGLVRQCNRLHAHFKCDTCGTVYVRTDPFPPFEEFARYAKIVEGGPLER